MFRKPHTEETKKKLSVVATAQSVTMKASGAEAERCKKISETMTRKRNDPEAKKAWVNSGEKISATRLGWSDERKKEIYENPERSRKISVGRKLYLAAHPDEREAMIKRFMAASTYRYLPNNVESNVSHLGVRQLEYTGDGSYFVTLEDDWHKNPDFVVREYPEQRRVKAVVEVMDFNYWHDRSEIFALPALYAVHGIHCLVIDAARCYSKEDLLDVKAEIEGFIEYASKNACLRSNNTEVPRRLKNTKPSKKWVNSVEPLSADPTQDNTEPSCHLEETEGVTTQEEQPERLNSPFQAAMLGLSARPPHKVVE